MPAQEGGERGHSPATAQSASPDKPAVSGRGGRRAGEGLKEGEKAGMNIKNTCPQAAASQGL